MPWLLSRFIGLEDVLVTRLLPVVPWPLCLAPPPLVVYLPVRLVLQATYLCMSGSHCSRHQHGRGRFAVLNLKMYRATSALVPRICLRALQLHHLGKVACRRGWRLRPHGPCPTCETRDETNQAGVGKRPQTYMLSILINDYEVIGVRIQLPRGVLGARVFPPFLGVPS